MMATGGFGATCINNFILLLYYMTKIIQTSLSLMRQKCDSTTARA